MLSRWFSRVSRLIVEEERTAQSTLNISLTEKRCITVDMLDHATTVVSDGSSRIGGGVVKELSTVLLGGRCRLKL